MNRKRNRPDDHLVAPHLLTFRNNRPPMLRASLPDRRRSSSASAVISPPSGSLQRRLTTIRSLSLQVKIQLLTELEPDGARVVETIVNGILIGRIEREENK